MPIKLRPHFKHKESPLIYAVKFMTLNNAIYKAKLPSF